MILTRVRRLAGRAAWNLLDQVLSSATNAVLSFLVAHAVGEAEFGGFAVAFTVFSVAVGVSRAVSTSPLGIRFADAEPAAFRTATGSASGTAFVLGVAVGAGCLAVAAALTGPASSALAAVGVVMPGLLVQDAWRQVFFAAGRPAAAALNDLVWALVQIGLVSALLVSGTPSVVLAILAWGFAALVGALLGVRQARTRPRPARARGWWRDHHDLSAPLVGEYVTLQSGQQGALLVIAAVGSLEALAALRGVQVLLGPTTILAVAALGFAVPELARRREVLTRARWVGVAAAISGSLAVAGFLWGLVFVLAPDALGSALLGATWPGVSTVLWPTIVAQVAAASAVGPSIVIVAQGRTPISFALGAVEAVLLLAGGVVGVLLDGAVGASWGFALAFAVMAPVQWVLMVRTATVGQSSRRLSI